MQKGCTVHLIETHWKYFGNKVFLASTAQIAPTFRHDGHLNKVVPYMLSYIPPWNEDETPRIENHPFTKALFVDVVPLGRDAEIVWGIHVGHKARNPQLSPFVKLPNPENPPLTKNFTLVLKGTPEEPVVVQGYPAPAKRHYNPPLPWQASAREVDGGVSFCRWYWNHHAYVLRIPKLIVPGTLQSEPPDWWRA